ncbi:MULTISPECIES: Na+/H+ antiporter [Streptomyces]|uniref:Na+/H+ antiporter n=1 Tax=Streptomyces thermoviolaceus subsp. thermoviolaceus TaxID=66860 RepID=A0ABX0YU28_STRTL|nr:MULTISPECIES: Na+/H+ antiporter [Streptomyces]MCM3265290.1 Na+/H+ antiporter [Streptomyces thermoviolaceus]NJP14525.1 Na+/H+ antiporter [Streptomyces thermoviolaceus subsp. thermoviolaceus]RSS05231.1 Na+/H+ antiporter [Streptomyces sp. WAC00469]WTD49607.1 Na+/H+ antiporter [Streptomyces thermoviolaceus]GGV62067.1 Na+/H+ antiporter [Streptomyces thermoviolaceus subsp. apingens]
MDQLTLLFAVLLGAVISVPVGDRLGLPAPVLMTCFGMVLAVADFVPNVDIPPELILPTLLPPLLYAAVRRTSWRQFAANKRPIFLLAVALVFVTTVCVAVVAHAIVPGLPLAAAVALGALIAPPDPVAATAVAGQLGLPRRLVSILEGEGLFNDVTAIVLYHVAIAAVVSGEFSVWQAGLELVLSAVVAVAVGLALGWGANKLLGLLEDATLQIGLTLLVPYASYVLAEELHGSGVLAVLTTALFLAEYAIGADDVVTRLAGHTVWDVVDTLVTGVAFGLIGLELHNVLQTASGRWGELLGWAAVIVGVVVLVRLLYLLPATWLTKRLHAKRDVEEEIPTSWRETVVMWWSGMRGVASVALALAIPLKTDSGAPFPDRDELVFIAFGVIVATLVVQGLTLPWLVRRLRVRADTEHEKELERQLAMRAAKAAKRRLREIEAVEDLPEDVSEQLLRRAFEIGLRIDPKIADEERREAHEKRVRRLERVRRIQSEMLSAARHEVLAARSEPGADPEIVDRVLRHLDVRSLR